MSVFIITLGDFLKNAGIVGMEYILRLSGAQKNRDYGTTEDGQGLWIEQDFAINADWTTLYFNAFIDYFGPSTVYQCVIDRIQIVLEKIEREEWKQDKAIKEGLKFITDKLLSNSYQSGFDNIRESVENPEVYLNLKANKLNEKMDAEELQKRLYQLQDFLGQPLCKETFTMKSIVYTYINRFWDGKCFLLRANAKKDMRMLFEKEFSEPLRSYWKSDHKKAKELCIDCGMPMDSKEKVSIAFMKEMADDLSRKRSAFWNCNVDAFLCPVCTFVYALAPLGFQLYANKFVFLNENEDVSLLLSANCKTGKAGMEAERQEQEKYSVWFARQLNNILEKKEKELSNIQVILRGRDADDKYMLRIIHKDALEIFKQPEVMKSLKWLGMHPYVKMKGEFYNVHEVVVMNILQYRNQYVLLNKLLREALDTDGLIITAYWVYVIQIWMGITRRKEQGGQYVMGCISMRNSGFNLRKELLQKKGTSNDECLRGTVYQLLNALSVGNESKFIDITIRLYSSSKLQMPDGFVYMLGNKEKFQEYGAAFVLGLKGSHPESMKEEK